MLPLAGAFADRVGEVPDVASSLSSAKKKNLLSRGRRASGDIRLSHTHTHTHSTVMIILP